MANAFTTDILSMAIRSRFAYAHFTEDKTGVPCPIINIATMGDDLKFTIDFRWEERDQPYPDYFIRTEIEFVPNGDFRILKVEAHGETSHWVAPYKPRPTGRGLSAPLTDVLASMCIWDFNEAHAAQVLDEA